MSKTIKALFFFLSLVFISALGGQIAHAGLLTNAGDVQAVAQTTKNAAGFTDMSPGLLAANIIGIALGLLGIIFLIIMVFAGYRWMTASGNEEAITKAKDGIKRAIIGLIIIMSAYAITYFIFNQLPFGQVGGTPSGNNPLGGTP